MSRTIIILNGPPGCGKDTIAKLMHEQAGAIAESFKYALYERTAEFLNIAFGLELTAADVQGRNDDRDLKERRWYGGHSCRRWLQIVSEAVVKPYRGKQFFGEKLALRVRDLPDDETVVVSDGGFPEEMNAVFHLCPHDRMYILRLRGRGEFGTDTRRYVKQGEVDAQVFDLELREGNPQAAVDAIRSELNV